MQFKLRVLEINPRELRTYQGRKWYQRAFQCFGMGKVFVHNESAAFGEEPAQIQEQRDLDEYQAGDYMADLEMRQGDRGAAVFYLTKLTRITQAKPANT